MLAHPLLPDKHGLNGGVMSHIISFAQFESDHLEKHIGALALTPQNNLFKDFVHYRQTIRDNHTNIDFVLWGEAIIDEIENRNLSRKFEDALNKITRL